MHIQAHDNESLRKLVRLLEQENRILKEKLRRENIPFDDVNLFEEVIENEEEYDSDQGGRINSPGFIDEKMAKQFFSMFWENGSMQLFNCRAKSEYINSTSKQRFA